MGAWASANSCRLLSLNYKPIRAIGWAFFCLWLPIVRYSQNYMQCSNSSSNPSYSPIVRACACVFCVSCFYKHYHCLCFCVYAYAYASNFSITFAYRYRSRVCVLRGSGSPVPISPIAGTQYNSFLTLTSEPDTYSQWQRQCR
jgi:hypothetical protein